MTGISQHGAAVGRRAAAVATAGGILVSTIATSAAAAPADTKTNDSKLSTDLGALTEQARQALEAAPVVTVAANVQVDVESVAADGAVQVTPAATITVTTAAPDRATAVSRTADRLTEAPAAASGSKVASIALRYAGVPYVYGGASPSGFDCSGFVSYVYAQLGIDLPHQSRGILNSSHTTQVSRAAAQPGDIIWSPGHVAIYLGEGMQIEAATPRTGTGVHKIWQSNPVFLRVS